MRGDHYDLSCFLCFEVSQASYTQDENITPRYFYYVSDMSCPNPNTKVQKKSKSILSFFRGKSRTFVMLKNITLATN